MPSMCKTKYALAVKKKCSYFLKCKFYDKFRSFLPGKFWIIYARAICLSPINSRPFLIKL